jgi:hypothetical protein
MRELKKQLEILIVDYFKDSYPDFPEGKVEPSESPDFIVTLKNKYSLGIELTRLNPASASPISDDAKVEIDFRSRIIEEMRESFERGSEQKLFVKFLFSEKEMISPEREMSVKAMTVAKIREAIKNYNSNCFFRHTLKKDVLPVGIKQVLIVNHPELSASVWERSNNLGVSNNVVDDIRKAIHKKDEKLRIYQKQHLNLYWLLINTDCLRGAKSFNLANKVLHEDFESRFQHVFLLDMMKTKVYQLV